MAVKVVLDIFPDYNFWFCSSVNLPPRKIFSSTAGEPSVGTISRSKKKEVIAHDLVMILASTILKKQYISIQRLISVVCRMLVNPIGPTVCSLVVVIHRP